MCSFRFQARDHERPDRESQRHTERADQPHQRLRAPGRRVLSVRVATLHVRRGQSDQADQTRYLPPFTKYNVL